MNTRANYLSLAPKAIEILIEQESYINEQFESSKTLTKQILELVKIRVSQINQCAFCINMHSKSALSYGENYNRIIGLSAWNDMPLYTEKELIALGWAELITEGKTITDTDYNKVINIFGEKATVDLTIAINAINSWNRIAKTFKPEVISYNAI